MKIASNVNLVEDLESIFEGTFEGAYSFEKRVKRNKASKSEAEINKGRKMNKHFNKKNNKYSVQ
jgi:hypothetical protein